MWYTYNNNGIFETIDNNKVFVIIVLDLSAAFDNIDHAVL